LADGLLKDVSGVRGLSEAYRKVLGGYFDLQPLRDGEKDRLSTLEQQAKKDQNADLVWFCQLAARGHPKVVSDFKITCHYTLVREDDTRHRVVSLENRCREKSGLKMLDSRSFTAPRDFRQWLADAGNFTWLAGERELERLVGDLFEEAAYLDVVEVPYFGQHYESGLWFFKDVAYGPNGEEILPDEHGVFWTEDKGYQVAAQGSDQQSFRQPLPQLRPHEGLIIHGGYKLVRAASDDARALQDLFRGLALCLRDTLGGGADGYLAIGSFLSFAAAREIFQEHGGFPGLWTTGERGGGKTTLVQLLMELFGFHMQSGIGLLRNSSAAGLQIAVEQFSNLPVWLDEWREQEVQPEKRGIVHSTFNRELPSKYAENGRMRAIRTAFIVVGESTTSDTATRNRFPLLQVCKERRRGNHLPWLKESRNLLFVLGRFLMRNRSQFVQHVMKELSMWLAAPAHKGTDERAKLVYGVPYAAFSAMAQLLESHQPEELEWFRNEMVTLSKGATEEADSHSDVSQFFQDLLAAITQGKFGHTSAQLKCYFRVERRETPHPPDAPNQNEVPWISWELYFKPRAVMGVLKQYKHGQNESLRLSQLDLRHQMSTKPYWLAPKQGMHRKRFDGDNTEGCWGIALDRHELGYHKVSDEDWKAYLEESGLLSLKQVDSEGRPADPRYGELYSIVHKLTSSK
jgi:hypothetical protein